MLISRGSRHVQLGFVRKAVRARYWAPRVGDRRNSVTARYDVFRLDARCQVQKIRARACAKISAVGNAFRTATTLLNSC